MKNIIAACFALMIFNCLQAQQKEGRVVYERTMQMQLRIEGMGEGERMLPRSRTDKMEVLFGNNQSVRRAVEEETPEPTSFEGNGIQIRTFGGGADDIVYNNFSEGRQVDQREFGGKTYVISDSVKKLDWKLTGETKTILGYPCQKAVANRTGTRMMMEMNNGKMERKEVGDTSAIVVWFTPSVPVSVAPEFQGQLPGLILEIDINKGTVVYKALEVQPKVNIALIKEPRSGKKVTAAEFTKEREKLMQEMQKNAGGSGRTIRMVN
jgi:GLPGLI family protein